MRPGFQTYGEHVSTFYSYHRNIVTLSVLYEMVTFSPSHADFLSVADDRCNIFIVFVILKVRVSIYEVLSYPADHEISLSMITSFERFLPR